jgi:hypothetical protein
MRPDLIYPPDVEEDRCFRAIISQIAVSGQLLANIHATVLGLREIAVAIPYGDTDNLDRFKHRCWP